MRDLELMAKKRGNSRASRVNLVLLPHLPKDSRPEKAPEKKTDAKNKGSFTYLSYIQTVVKFYFCLFRSRFLAHA